MVAAAEENRRPVESGGDDDDDDRPLIYKRSKLTRKRVREDTVGSNSITVTLTDPKVLDCSTCNKPLTIPVFQCDNGHLACSRCCSLYDNVCTSCSLPVGGDNRCRSIEKVLKSIKSSCKNITYGCKETISYNKKYDHELICIHEPCSCPHPSCEFVASSKLLYLHYSKHLHSAIAFNYDSYFIVPAKKGMEYVILQESVDKTLFVFSYGVQSFGNVANITCIAPESVAKVFSYELVARKGDSTMKLESFTEQWLSYLDWSYYLTFKAFILVPSDFLDSSGGHCFQVRIWRAQGKL